MDVTKTLEELNDVEKQQVLDILNDVVNGKLNSYENMINEIWDEIPVDIDTFMDDERYMRNYFYPDGKSCIVYPRWRKELRQIFKNPYKYSEICFTGGIGLGKSEAAKIGICYLLYRVMCLKNPQLFYNKPIGKPIAFLFFNNNLSLAESVLLKPVVEMLASSPWFMKHGEITGREHLKYKAHKNIVLLVGSRDTHALGMDVFATIIDEINFASGQDVSLEKSKIMATYAVINSRITNRFRVEGNVHGKLFMVSSKKSEYDFLEQYAQKMKDQENFYMVDDKVWNIVPREKTGYSGKMFNLAIGGDILPSKIIPDNENPDDYIKQGYSILEVPIEEKQKFVLDMERSLMDIAAVSISYVTKFLNYDLISQCYCEDENPFTQEVIMTGIKDELEIKDFFVLNKVSNDIIKKPMFIHIDTSLTGDNTGISGVSMLYRQKYETFDLQSNKTIKTYKTIYKHTFTIEIKCPKNSEISFQKTRNFIIYLRKIGFNICGVSVDGFQSTDTIQLLQLEGFKNVNRLNFERTPEIYLSLRNSLIEERIKLLKLNLLERELLLVERNNQTGKFTHPRTEEGHGDGCDSLAGALYSAISHEDEYTSYLSTTNFVSNNEDLFDQNNILKTASGIYNIQQEYIESNNTKSNNKKKSISSWIL